MPSEPSIRRGLISRLATALAAIGVIGAVAAYFLGSSYAGLVYDLALFDDVASLAGQITVSDEGFGVNLPLEARKWLLANESEAVIYRVTNLRNGEVISSSGDLGALPSEMAGPGEPQFRNAQVGNRKFRVAYTRHLVDPLDIPVLVEVGETLGKRTLMTRQILGGTLLLIGIMIAVAVGMIRRGVNRELAPLREIEEETARRAGMNLTPLDTHHAPREVRGLIDAINRMMARLSEATESQRRFTANAAHQLRTPVARVRLQAQIALRKSSLEAVRSELIEIERGTAHAARVIDQLLMLSKAESASERKWTSERVDLAEVAHHAIERYLQLAIEREIDLGYDGVTIGAHVAGTGLLLEELLGNLIDNSIRYGRPGGRVTVATALDAGTVVLSVEDDGPGFSEDEAKRVFQRFNQSDFSAGEGAGLGLAIVKEIADRFAARISLETTPGHGSRFILVFPH
jgi:two-component system sensor histidine kinase TctE